MPTSFYSVNIFNLLVFFYTQSSMENSSTPIDGLSGLQEYGRPLLDTTLPEPIRPPLAVLQTENPAVKNAVSRSFGPLPTTTTLVSSSVDLL